MNLTSTCFSELPDAICLVYFNYQNNVGGLTKFPKCLAIQNGLILVKMCFGIHYQKQDCEIYFLIFCDFHIILQSCPQNRMVSFKAEA